MEHSEEGALKYQHKNWSPSEIDNLSKKKASDNFKEDNKKSIYLPCSI